MKYDQCVHLLREDELTIFLLHGVIEQNAGEYRNLNRKHIFASEFRHFIEKISVKGHALSMDEVISICLGAPLPKNSFAITFDDGFRNNLTVAAPILEAYNVPATFYLTSDFLDSNSMSWIDRIEFALEKTKASRGLVVNLPWRSSKITLSTNNDKRQLLDELRSVVKKNAQIDQQSLANSLQFQLMSELITSSDLEVDKKMSWPEARLLASHELFTVGGHTHTHPIMSFLSSHELEFEIKTNINAISHHLGIATTHFAYPEGLEHCFNDSVITCLMNNGIRCCPTAVHGHNRPGSDLFKLKRIFVT